MQIGALNFNTREFQRFPIDHIVDNSTTDFDLFLNISEHLILYGALGYRWVREELERLLRTGHTHFFVRLEDFPRVKQYELLAKLPMLEKELAPKQRIVSIEQVGAAFTQCLYEGDITPACVEKAKQISDALASCVAEDTSCIQALSGLADHDFYTYFHSVRVGAYSVAVAIEMGLTDEDKLREIALGGIFHDIGKKDVGLPIINKTGPLTDGEWEVMKSHPEKGHRVISESVLSHVPREIVLHHHEKLDGSGYPHGLDRNSLLPEVQIATLADVFDALTSSRAYQNKRSRFEALDLIKHKMVGSKLPTDAYKALIKCLAS